MSSVLATSEPEAHEALVRLLAPLGLSLVDPGQVIETVIAWSEGRSNWYEVEAALSYR